MPEYKNTKINRPGGYSTPLGIVASQREEYDGSKIQLLGDTVAKHEPLFEAEAIPTYLDQHPDTRLYVGDCRDILPGLPDTGCVDLIFADPPFNWEVPYDGWEDNMPRNEFERFTFDWLDACVDVLSPTGSIWVSIPDDTAAEVVMHLKRRGLTMINWCMWHFRFGQHREGSFIMSKVHALYFVKDPLHRTWNGDAILEQSDRASIYNDKRTQQKESHKGMRVPMDVWYGKFWGRIQGNNKERRQGHHNQKPRSIYRANYFSVFKHGRCRVRPICRKRHNEHRCPRTQSPIDWHRTFRSKRQECVGANHHHWNDSQKLFYGPKFSNF